MGVWAEGQDGAGQLGVPPLAPARLQEAVVGRAPRGHGAQLQLGLEAVPTCHQEEAKTLSHSGTVAGSLARKLAFADPWPRQRGRNEASLEGPPSQE